MLSLGGIPPTAGFMASSGCSAPPSTHYYWLAVIGVLNSAISLLLRPHRRLHVSEEGGDRPEPVTTPALAVVLGVAVAATLVLGVYPRLLFEVAEKSGADARRGRSHGALR
jgi:NADH-quinone oxidoreductase subunit N